MVSRAATAEISPRLTVGRTGIDTHHLALAGSIRFGLGPVLFLEPEFLVLNGLEPSALDHQGPLLSAGLQGLPTWRVRPHLAFGTGPVKTRRSEEDKRIGCLSAGATIAVSRNRRVFLLPEARLGLLGEDGYGQVGLSLGVKLGRK